MPAGALARTTSPRLRRGRPPRRGRLPLPGRPVTRQAVRGDGPPSPPPVRHGCGGRRSRWAPRRSLLRAGAGVGGGRPLRGARPVLKPVSTAVHRAATRHVRRRQPNGDDRLGPKVPEGAVTRNYRPGCHPRRGRLIRYSAAVPAATRKGPYDRSRTGPFRSSDLQASGTYLLILVTWPAPTVRPPSRMANFRPSSMATGWMSSTFISVLSPGMTISVPSGRVTTPVTSVVRK